MSPKEKDLEAGFAASHPRTTSPVYHVPDWEGTVRPALSRKQSIINKVSDRTKSLKASSVMDTFADRTKSLKTVSFLPKFPPSTHSRTSRSSTMSSAGDEKGKGKAVTGSDMDTNDKAFELGLYAQHTASLRAGTARRQNINGTARVKAKVQDLFNRVFPPQKTYFGRSRKTFLLAVILPLATLFFFILPLSIGLGLRGKNHTPLPLPSNKDVFEGDLTYYSPGLGACGWTDSDDEMVVAVSRLLWDAEQVGSNPNTNPLCGKRIRVQREFAEANKGLQSIDVTVVDRCVGCEAEDLDLTIAGFKKLALKEQGRVIGKWAWLDDED